MARILENDAIGKIGLHAAGRSYEDLWIWFSVFYLIAADDGMKEIDQFVLPKLFFGERLLC